MTYSRIPKGIVSQDKREYIEPLRKRHQYPELCQNNDHIGSNITNDG